MQQILENPVSSSASNSDDKKLQENKENFLDKLHAFILRGSFRLYLDDMEKELAKKKAREQQNRDTVRNLNVKIRRGKEAEFYVGSVGERRRKRDEISPCL